MVDDGCAKAMQEKGSSLLPAGLLSVEGEFEEKSTVRVLDSSGREIARGITNYDSETLRRIAGHRSDEISMLLPAAQKKEVIHRDNMVLMA